MHSDAKYFGVCVVVWCDGDAAFDALKHSYVPCISRKSFEWKANLCKHCRRYLQRSQRTTSFDSLISFNILQNLSYLPKAGISFKILTCSRSILYSKERFSHKCGSCQTVASWAPSLTTVVQICWPFLFTQKKMDGRSRTRTCWCRVVVRCRLRVSNGRNCNHFLVLCLARLLEIYKKTVSLAASAC